MSAFLVAIMFGAGIAGWVWSKVSQRTGNADPKTVYLTAGGAGLAAFIVFFTLLKYVIGL